MPIGAARVDRARSWPIVAALFIVASAWIVALPTARAGVACTIIGTNASDVLAGTPGVDVICGLGGNDVLRGMAGSDTLFGGKGADVLIGGNGDDVLDGGKGIDTVSYRNAPSAITASLGAGTATGEGTDTLVTVEHLTGSPQGDTLDGSERADRIDGGGGRDVIRGLDGDDDLTGGDANDTLLGGDGDDQVSGGLDQDHLEGRAGDDILEGGPATNRMVGGPGVDTCVQQEGLGNTTTCERLWRPVVFATALGLSLYEPAVDPVLITYHESLFGSAVALHPRGHMILNANPRKFAPPPATPGPGYVVMGPRGRAPPATSASDDVMRPGTPVLAPVSGRVLSVTPYRLYCEAYDIRIIIRPDDRPHVSVVVFHVNDVRVHAGQRVAYSSTVLGIPRVFGGIPQTDTYVAGHNPHVHIEVERNGSSPIPGCRLRAQGRIASGLRARGAE